ncbi:MAG: radical SAM protein [Candidatus Bathyarchaeota archaeon]|nr:radical SAM protein [Candidatus Bathyarchaeum tardum]WGM90020.1 MAG: radical SAM protein [Candidatus Bathyarchaeum tardum]WNZ29838.1 MAG: radical SAM protein [Candidatus Bathyarchaeota archaeon]
MTEQKILRETFSVCPVCYEKIKAQVVEKDGKILIEKTCKEHGNFSDTYWSRADIYHKAEEYKRPSSTPFKDNCPEGCAVNKCPNHVSATVMAVIDVTNECDLRCPICFANASQPPDLYKPSKEKIHDMLKFLKKQDPAPLAVMFAGGEPTVRDDIVEIVQMAHDLKYMILLATNGVRMSNDPELVRKLKKAGLNIVYMQFDGLTDAPYKKLRNAKLLPNKLRLVELCRKHDIEIILVPTVQGSINDNEVGDIVKFAAKNVDIVRGIVFQPMSFTGRTHEFVSRQQRIDNSLLAQKIAEQTNGLIQEDDMFPVSVMDPPLKIMNTFLSKIWPPFTPTPYCGLWNWILVSRRGNHMFTPINRFLNFDVFMSDLKNLNLLVKEQKISKLGIYLRLFLASFKSLDWRKVQREAGLLNAIKTLVQIHTNPSYDSLGPIRRRLLLIGSMAFMDPYTFDVERAHHCVIHYATPDNRIIPFCVYNMFYRQHVEKQFSIPRIPVKQK